MTAENTTSKAKQIARPLLGTMLIFAGISHLSFLRNEFQAQVPDWVPVSKDLTVILSGIAEILLGSALVFLKKYKSTIGWIAAAFFAAVFPGNVHQYVDGIDAFGLDSDAKRLARLFFQPVLIAWAVWATRD